MTRIGVLALQGAFIEHIAVLKQIGVESIPVRLPGELEGLDGLVIPGGESTSIGKLMRGYEISSAVKKLIDGGLPVLGTCAGMILLAKQIIGQDGYSLNVMSIQVRRNAFGRQVDSFEVDLSIPTLGDQSFPAVFIRAPWIESVGPGVEVLACLQNGTPVAVREKNLLAVAFHPELTADTRLHAYFTSIVEKSR